MFVTAADFTDPPYSLPGLTNPGAVDTFPIFVTEQEQEWLRKLVGNLFYDALVAGINALPAVWNAATVYAINDKSIYGGFVWKALSNGANHVPVEGADWTKVVDPLVDRWIKLRDGEDYQVATIQNCPTFKWVGMVKMVQPMIYSLWLKLSARINSGQGMVVGANENSELISPGPEIAKTWRKYRNIAVGNLWRSYYSVVNTFYGYLVARATVFDDIITDGSYSNFLSYIQNQLCSPGGMNEFDL